jgi:hypothetical protein
MTCGRHRPMLQRGRYRLSVARAVGGGPARHTAYASSYKARWNWQMRNWPCGGQNAVASALNISPPNRAPQARRTLCWQNLVNMVDGLKRSPIQCRPCSASRCGLASSKCSGECCRPEKPKFYSSANCPAAIAAFAIKSNQRLHIGQNKQAIVTLRSTIARTSRSSR